jgi:hypothetical protein
VSEQQTVPGGAFTADHYRFLPLDEAVNPAEGGFFMHYVNKWWAVHPDKGLAFFNAPGRRRSSNGLGAAQCNTDERIARMVSANAAWPVEVRQIPSAWVPVDISDYQAG